MIGYHLFGYLWAFWLFLGINQVSLAGAYATWYWTMDKHSLPHFPVMRSFYRTLRYHLGSVAIGSLMLAIVSFLQIVLMVLRRFRAAKNPVVQWIICCFLCCLKCVQYILKFINKNAYIKIAISGEAFCKSASSALALLVKNALRLAAVDLVSGFLLLVSKLGIAALVAFIAYLYVGANSTTLQLNFPLLTVILSGLVALLIAIAFLGVFQMAIDTIFLCFLDDCDKNDGSPERPFYMSDNLKSIVNKANQLAPQASRVKMSKSIDEF